MCSKKLDVSHPGKTRGSGKNTFCLVFKKKNYENNVEKCHLTVSSDESFSINIDNEILKNSNDKKTVRSKF